MEFLKMEDRQIMSAEIGELIAALNAFQTEFKQPELNKSNPYFKSRYIDLSGCFKAAQPLLAKNGLAITQIVNGTTLVTMLMHKSGQWLRSYYDLQPQTDEQKRGSAITYAKRYSYCALLGIAADTDDDGNAASGRTPNAPKQAPDYSKELQEAMNQLSCCNTKEDARQLFTDWKKKCDPICTSGSAFFKAVADKVKTLPDKIEVA